MIGIVQAQEGFHVSIQYKPERIEIVPHVFQLYGTIVQSKDGKYDKLEAYAITMNEEVITSVQRELKNGVPQVLFGPSIEKLVIQMVIDDYKQFCTDRENSLKKSIDEETDAGKKADLKKQLKREQASNKANIKRLKTIIERYKVRCIYVHGVGKESAAPSGGNNDEWPDHKKSCLQDFFITLKKVYWRYEFGTFA